MDIAVNLARMYYPIHTLGPGKRVGIWLAGCDRGCPECITPELQKCSGGSEVSINEIMGYITGMCGDATGFTISGGEPFFFPEQLKNLIKAIAALSDDIIIYTGYTMEELRTWENDDVNYILSNISVLIDGPYVKELNDGVGLRGSSNQHIHILKNNKLYRGIENTERKVQLVVGDNRVMTIGIPKVDSND